MTKRLVSAEVRALQRRAQSALAKPLAASGVALDIDARTERLDDNLAAPLTPSQAERVRRDFGAGAGGELYASARRRPKLHSAHSSGALAVSGFAPFLDRPPDLLLGGRSGFTHIAFEAKLPTGVRGTPPHLDLIAGSPDGRVAVESKCTEYLTLKTAKFSSAYQRLAAAMHPSWRSIYEELEAEPDRFELLDAAQLIKHYWGLLHTRRQGTDVLLYLFWEPQDPEQARPFDRHRAEVEAFADRAADPLCRFEAMSYPELWEAWEHRGGWMAEHATWQKTRYGVSLGEAGPHGSA
jgi:hypothetical protein